MSTKEHDGQEVDDSTIRRAIAAAAIGNGLEWFDFGVYGYFAVIIGHVFFPTHSATASLLSAFAVSSLFLAFYVLHKASRGFESTTFHADGLAKLAYLAMLASHVVLAATVPVLAITLIRLGLTGRIAAHRRLARIAWPLWMYVSVTGILIYLLLYHWNPTPN